MGRHYRNCHPIPELVTSGIKVRHYFLKPKYADRLAEYDNLERMVEEDEFFFELDPNADDIAYASTRCGQSSEEVGG